MNRWVDMRLLVIVVGVFAAFLGFGFPAVADAGMVRLNAGDGPAFDDDLLCTGLADGIAHSVIYYRKLPAKKTISYGGDSYSANQLARGLESFQAFLKTGPSPVATKAFLKKHAVVYAHLESNKLTDVLFTGYFVPQLAGSKTRSERFSCPVYRRPRDLVVTDTPRGKNPVIGRYSGKKLIPYFDRKTIDSTNILADRAEPIAWVSDPITLFFLHVQGSGTIRMDTGELINVLYDVNNGLTYRSIGKYLIDKGKLKKEEVSMQTIRDYVVAHPEERDEIFHYNPRYVFFRTPPHGAVGCLGVPLTPGRSVALDRAISPAGSLLFIKTQKPICDSNGKVEKWTDFSRFALNQDTGTAINGPGRADIFWGSGAYAETAAGYMKHHGNMYYIVIRP